jgi:CRISPR-associated protein Csb2
MAIMQDDIVIDPTRAPARRRARHQTETDAPVLRSTLTAARFALSATVLPSLADAIAIGDRIRMSLLHHSDGHPIFTGRDATGNVRRGLHHDHAWFLPADDDADGAIDHVLVYARRGFDLAAVRALARLRRVWGHGGPDLTVTLVALGAPSVLGCLRRDGGHARTPQLGTARIWESLTPFVPPRHIKYRATGARDTANEQIARLLALHGRPLPRIEPLASEDATAPRPPGIAWQRFRRLRTSGGGSRGGDVAFGFRLCFDQPLTGPIALGYAAHQGLGQFVAVA